MSVNIFGSSGRDRSGTNHKYVDEKFATLSINLATKVNKSGDSMTADLNMGNNKITSKAIPNTDEVLTNKAYVDSKVKAESSVAKVYIDTLISTKLDRNIEADVDMKEFTIYNVKYPIDPYDVTNKLYVHVSMQNDDITVEKLLKIGTIIEDLFEKHKKEISINKYRQQFITTMGYIRTMDTKYRQHFDDYTDESVTELVKSCVIYQDLKILLILIIEDLPLAIFLQLKSNLIKGSLVSSTEIKTLGKRCRRFINRCSKDIDPTRLDNVLELFIQKNLLLIDMGFFYFTESLLKTLLDG